jgi:hypothetical protein
VPGFVRWVLCLSRGHLEVSSVILLSSGPVRARWPGFASASVTSQRARAGAAAGASASLSAAAVTVALSLSRRRGARRRGACRREARRRAPTAKHWHVTR